ncbi:hypothetical protein [Flavobacterium nackdongense]|uniref:DUF4468 domain-containing protein n=1 Tax=Flavobacterium nackdongense TaxID=2547394 RepID=A0A4P6YG85_9FLAO|nr:hypothetical protein [Flavobacterium nackdongense]QBN19944.1 hypothetical protein E1750_14435 [Flavobacterium nackdongense]
MKKNILILLLFVVSYSFAQSVNDYKAVIIPLKYDLQKTDNQYRLQTITKMNLQKAGFKAFYATETIPGDITDRCSLLYLDVQKDNAFLVTKVFITLKDCYGTEIYKSAIGKSREKEFEAAYVDALNLAFASVYSLNYAYNGNTDFSPKAGMTAQTIPVMAAPVIPAPTSAVPVVTMTPAAAAVAVPVVAAVPVTAKESKTVEKQSSGLLYAQPTSYGYQLIDSEPKVVMKVYKTSNANSYMAKKGDVQGALVSKENQWFFEYYQNDQLISEKIDVKF